MQKNKFSILLAAIMFAVLGMFSGVSAAALSDLDPEPNKLDFGTVDVDSDDEMTVTLTNDHVSDSITITDLVIGGDNPGRFDIGNEDCDGAVLTPGDECDIDIIFDPSSERDYEAILEITTDIGVDPKEIVLEGTGGEAGTSTNAQVTISDDNIDFEDTMVDYVSMQQFDITNNGSDSFKIDDIGLYGADDEHYEVFDRDCLDVTLAADKSCTVLILFEPDTTGVMVAEVEVVIAGESDEFIIDLEGEAIAASADVSVSPKQKDFGVAEKGEGDSITFTVDVGTASVRINSVLTGSGDFEIEDDDCDGEDIGNDEDSEDCDIVVNYNASAAGFVAAVLEINADNEDFFIPVYAFVEGSDDYPADIAGTTFEAFIKRLIDAGVVNGYSDGTFRPDEPVTRGQLAKFIFNAFDITEDTSCGAFSDVDTTNTFYTQIVSLKCAEIISGYSDGTYRSDNSVTRGEVTKFITEALEEKGVVVDLEKTEGFPDVDETDTFYGYIAYLSSVLFEGQKVISGYSDGEFKSSDNLSRGQMSKMVDISMRYYKSV